MTEILQDMGGNPILIHEGYRYRKDKEYHGKRGSKIYWRCEDKAHKHCEARGVTSTRTPEEKDFIVERTGEHTHPPDTQKTAQEKAIINILDSANSSQSEDRETALKEGIDKVDLKKMGLNKRSVLQKVRRAQNKRDLRSNNREKFKRLVESMKETSSTGKEITPELKKMMDESLDVRKHAYCPYSKFRVGAAVLCEDGSVFSGCNVENVSFGMTVCAERIAVWNAISKGHKKFKAIAISCDLPSSDKASCGACRQVLAEFGTDWDIYLVNPDSTWIRLDWETMLPYAFTPASLPPETASDVVEAPACVEYARTPGLRYIKPAEPRPIRALQPPKIMMGTPWKIAIAPTPSPKKPQTISSAPPRTAPQGMYGDNPNPEGGLNMSCEAYSSMGMAEDHYDDYSDSSPEKRHANNSTMMNVGGGKAMSGGYNMGHNNSDKQVHGSGIAPMGQYSSMEQQEVARTTTDLLEGLTDDCAHGRGMQSSVSHSHMSNNRQSDNNPVYNPMNQRMVAHSGKR